MEILEGDTTYAPSSIFIIYHIILSLTSFIFNMYILCRQWKPAFLFSDPLCCTWLSGMWYMVMLLGDNYAAQFWR